MLLLVIGAAHAPALGSTCELLVSEKDIKGINVKKKSRYLYEELIFIIFRGLLL
jgi:hypothetical protein